MYDIVTLSRNALYEKNNDLTAELETLSETYRKFHKDMTEKNDKVCFLCVNTFLISTSC